MAEAKIQVMVCVCVCGGFSMENKYEAIGIGGNKRRISSQKTHTVSHQGDFLRLRSC